MRADWLTIAALVACAPQPRPQAPAKAVPSVAAPAPAAAVAPPAASADVPREAEPLEQPVQASTRDPVRCPDPYHSDGWVPKAEVSAEQARAMNERFGLICSKRALPSTDEPWIREDARAVPEQRAGCTDKRGRIVIPFIYVELSHFAASGLALALEPGVGWVYIDHRHRRIGQALSLDNRPDETFGGYARLQVANGKIGFLDHERRLVIPARYDDAFPFVNCTALVCVGCHPLRWTEDAPAEAACTGDAFVIDEAGRKVESSGDPDAECGEKKAR